MYTLAIGAVCDERRHDLRHNLRRHYARHVASGELLVRFVVSDDRLHDQRWRAREVAANGSTGAVDDLLFVPATVRSTMLETADCPGHEPGTRRCWSSRTPYREAHCAHKTMGWWQVAGRWPARWYGKTDDDALIDMPALLFMLRAVLAPIGGAIYGGIVHYSSLNTTNLEGACFSSGGNSAARYKRRYCPTADMAGPYPYVEGPLEILAPETQRFLAQRAARDPRMRCHYEDLYVGVELSAHPSLRLVNLERLLGRKDIYVPGRREYIGADGLLAHWVRSQQAYERVAADFERKRALHAAAGGGAQRITREMSDGRALALRVLEQQLAGTVGAELCGVEPKTSRGLLA